MTVYDYFTEKLGFIPSEDSLAELDINTPCGRDCVAAIDRYAALLATVDSHPSVILPLLKSANAQVEVLWIG